MENITTPNDYLKPEQGRLARYLIYYRQNRALLFLSILTALFIILAVLIHSRDVQTFDTRASLVIQRWHPLGLDKAMKFFTYLGSIGTVVVVAVLSAIFFARLGKIKSVLIIGLSLLSYPLNVLIKDFVERNRPYSTIVRVLSPNSGFSFPSGHAMISMTVYGTITYLFWIYLKSHRYRALILAVATVTVGLIGLSRIYLGAHWVTDVTGGWIAGLILNLLLAEFHKKLTQPSTSLPEAAK